MNFPMVYFDDVVEARRMIRVSLMKRVSSGQTTVKAYPLYANRNKKNMMAFMYLEPGTHANFSETMTKYGAISSTESWINGYEFEILNGKDVYWSPCLFPGDWIPDT